MGGPLGDAVGAVCAELRPALSPSVAVLVDQVVTRLDGPPQLAVAGRMKSGKSTVVNALIGRRVAPTDVRECTRPVTRFRYGTVDRVEIVHTDGSRHTLPYDAAEQALTLALDGAIARRVDQLDVQIKQVDEALRVSAGERDRLRQGLSGVADRIVGVVTGVDALLPALRGAR